LVKTIFDSPLQHVCPASVETTTLSQ